MRRLLLVSCSAVGLLALLPVSGAVAVELPVRKAGLWEMKVLSAGAPSPEMTMQQCTDETTDKDMSTAFSPMAKEMCSKQDIQKTATGYVTDSVCGIAGMTIKSHAEINGDFNSAYTVKSTSHSEGGDGRRRARQHHDDRGQMARRLQGRSEGRRHHDARRHEDEHQGHGKAEGPDSEAAGEVAAHRGCSQATWFEMRGVAAAPQHRGPHREEAPTGRANARPMTGSAPSRRDGHNAGVNTPTPAPLPPPSIRPSGCR